MATLYTHQGQNIRKTWLLISVFLLVVFYFFILGFKFSYAEVIRHFDSKIRINDDSSVLITETINYDFENQEKHGIYRTIPLNYKAEGQLTHINIKVLSVTDEFDNSYRYKITSRNPINIKIGDPDRTVTGSHVYKISYEVKNLIAYTEQQDFLYWNLSGNEWDVPIDSLTATITLPKPALTKAYGWGDFCGQEGEKLSCGIYSIIDDKTITYTKGKQELKPGDGVTVLFNFSKDIVYEPSKTEKIISYILNNIIFLLPIIVFIFMFFIWDRYGKDPRKIATVIAQYEPPQNVKPTMVGSLIDEKVDFRDITAGLIYLAEQGFVKIKRLEKKWALGNADYEIELTKKDTINLGEIEKNILLLFFNKLEIGEKIMISNFKKDLVFRTKLKNITKYIYQEMKDSGFYEKNPKKVKMIYISIGITLCVLFGQSGFPNDFLGIETTFSLVLCGTIILIFGLFMSKKTKLGVITKNHIMGFKEFLSVTEKDRLNFHNAPEKDPRQFMEFLPYAIALGVEKKWAKQFENIYIPEQSWYVNGTMGSFIVSDFISDISSFSTSFGSISGSSGVGGVSGGGGGGGGGGSW